MKRLLSIEFHKIWKNRSSRILSLTYFVLLGFIALLASVNFNFIGVDYKLADTGIFNFPLIWHVNSYMAGVLKFFLSIVVISMVTNEYSYGTLKQNLIDGMSKKEFLASKVLMLLAFALASVVFVFFLTLILGYSYSSYTALDLVFTDLSYLLGYFTQVVMFCCFCLFLAFLIKRSAFALGFMAVYFLFEGALVNILRSPQWLSRFYPFEAMYNLVGIFWTRLSAYRNLETQLAGKEIVRHYGIRPDSIAIGLAWSVIFVLMSYWLLKKRDL